MSQGKSERLMNLVIALLVTRQYLSRERLRQVVEGYHGHSDEAFERMFERDKEELREIGIPIDVGSYDAVFDDEPGYRIRRDAFELPDIELEADEAAVVGLAARVWQHARLARETSGALLKLRAAGIDVDSDRLSLVEPRLAAAEEAFEPVWEATTSRTPVGFHYTRPGQAPQPRRVEPWTLLSWHGRWYLLAHDRDRDAPRMFRLSRITGSVRPLGGAGSYEVPSGIDVRALASQLSPTGQGGTAVLRLREGAGLALRRRAQQVEPPADGWQEVTLPYDSHVELAGEIVELADDVVVLRPPELRGLVVDRLRRLAGAR
ncbi:MAG: FIG005453: Putative DeoR-family transcriptional regulator [uncultured Nocardioidaceae bacterium]|uniref:FIG005453: Putative DeoR-family transcriptional regulator n=1 Tax=uncultured Nocardioidaceae bacterium TaxID=253824 RepID=A0A6J4M379_9ACTN|nr:MAG: FIG005453: Putative DeoR-family transcriptional regulator [uncultured Nocardioidaceae bacterium]